MIFFVVSLTVVKLRAVQRIASASSAVGANFYFSQGGVKTR